jgi:hypothetical protein
MLAWTRWPYRGEDEDRDWDWWRIYLECLQSRGRYECFAATARDELQGLMVLDLQGRRVSKLRCLAVDYLATNPANRLAHRGLKHVGSALMALAVMQSRKRGMAGRVWLESLTGAESFYEGLGMNRLARRSREGNVVYVLDETAANELVEVIRRKGIIGP